MILKFTIIGNQEDQFGNPIPKLKMTGKQHWTEPARRYVAWKQYVRLWYGSDARFKNNKILKRENLDGGCPLKLAKDEFARMDIKIWWANEKHPDAENVFGSIADALFENDKHLNGSFVAQHCPEKKGRVEVRIEINE